MEKIYKNQSKLDIKLNVNIDCSGATETLIKYEKPDGSTGEWTASVDSSNSKILVYEVPNTTVIDQVKDWTLWAKVTFGDARVAFSEPVKMRIYNEGE